MKRFMQIVLITFFASAAFNAHAKVMVFSCEPEWAALTKEIGGALVNTYSATHALQDPHHIRARPSLIAKVRNADLIFCSGSGLEAGWLPLLVRKAANDVQPNSLGYLMAADHVPVLEKTKHYDRSQGDVHPEGNPHVHLNPYNILLIAKVLTQRLSAIDPSHQRDYQQRYDDFSSRWKQAIQRWEQQATALNNKAIISHHKSFSYLFDWLKLRELTTLEPKPGIPPSSAHLKHVLTRVSGQDLKAIVRTPYDPAKASQWLAKKTNVPAIVLPFTVGGDQYSTDLFALFERTITLLSATIHE